MARLLLQYSMAAVWAIVLVALSTSVVRGDELSHIYAPKEEVVVYANKIGPFNNPLETYAFFELPGCQPASWEHKFPSLGQALVGDELFKMNVPIKFQQNVESETICRFTPTEAQAAMWKSMIEEQYWYQLYADDLPMWATLGKMENGAAKIFTHQQFKIGVNGERIVVATLEAKALVAVKAGKEYHFTYGAQFVDDKTVFENRFRRYLDNSFFEHRIHWFSIFNSFMMVLFLAGLVLTILFRTLRADYARMAKEREEDPEALDWGDENGWKRVHCDVFRVPPQPALLSAVVGTGCHLLILGLLTILIAIASVVYTSPGSLLTYCVLAYVLTSFTAGYFSSNQLLNYVRLGPNLSSQWMKTMGLTAFMFPGYMLCSGFLLNLVAIVYNSAQAIPFGGMLVMLLLWLFACCPLVVVGTMVSRHLRPVGGPGSPQGKQDIPHISQIPSAIPPVVWYRSRLTFVVAGGLLPFGSIFIELYFVFTSFWHYKYYYLYGFMLLVSTILVLVTACVAVVCCYFLLNGEEHRWPWTTFGIGASIGGYIMLYAAYFYFFKTKMTGLFMFLFYFSYMTMMCVGIAIMCGTVAFLAASKFVKVIYSQVKAD